jgi:hypothetical protein
MTWHAILVAWGFPAISCLISIAIWGFRPKKWRQRARRLARTRGIQLPPYLEQRVSRFLRNSWIVGLLVNWIAFPLSNGIIKTTAFHGAVAWFPEVLAAAPLYLAVLCYSYLLGVRWRASGRPRLAHLGRISPWQAFTAGEVFNLTFGFACIAAAMGYGLRLAHAAPGWWVACAAGLAVAVAAWWHLVLALIERRSSASDMLELGWDDVLRFERVRTFTLGCAWLPATYIFLADLSVQNEQALAAGAMGFDFSWIYLVAGIWCITMLTFRQGRRLWRRAWE